MPDLKKHFNEEAAAFDSQIRKTISYYDEMLEALVNSIPDTSDSPKVLDLGCGTGNITIKVLERFPNAKITCLDLSENMIEIAKEKLADYNNIEYVVGDFTIVDIIDSYDAIISSLALHHIPNDEEKEVMYQHIYNALNKDGVFYNADVIKPNSQYNNKLNDLMSKKYMLKHGVLEEEIKEHYAKRESNDIPTTLITHFKLLENVGFKELDLIWKYYSFAVYGATKK